jgi:hypothetical protein
MVNRPKTGENRQALRAVTVNNKPVMPQLLGGDRLVEHLLG